MKKSVTALGVVSAVVMMAGNVMAAPATSELKVVGQMAVPACKVDAKELTVDLGSISHTLIKPSVVTALATKDATIGVTCEAETFLNFTVNDNREGTASVTHPYYFGLGNVNGSGKLGYYSLILKNALVDGVSSMTYMSPKGSSSVSAVASSKIMKNYVVGWAKSHGNQNSGKRFVATLEVSPVLASSKMMGGPITDNVKLDGSATLNFSYGL